MENENSPVLKTGNLSLANPQDVMEFGKQLKNYINKNKLSTVIQGKDYAHVDGWKFAGLNFGLVSIPESPQLVSSPGETFYVFFNDQGKKYMATNMPESIEKELKSCKSHSIIPLYKYKCDATVINIATGAKVGFGTAICTNMEIIKTSFDEYAVLSMSQTRSIGKSLRNLLGFVMNSAGLEGTPAEEMDESYSNGNTKKKKWDETISNEILLLTDEKSLLAYYAQLPELHSDVRFTAALTKQREKLGIPKERSKK